MTKSRVSRRVDHIRLIAPSSRDGQDTSSAHVIASPPPLLPSAEASSFRPSCFPHVLVGTHLHRVALSLHDSGHASPSHFVILTPRSLPMTVWVYLHLVVPLRRSFPLRQPSTSSSRRSPQETVTRTITKIGRKERRRCRTSARLPRPQAPGNFSSDLNSGTHSFLPTPNPLHNRRSTQGPRHHKSK